MAAITGFQCFLVRFLKWTYFYCLFTLLMLSLCCGLYEDQVGLFDWRQRYIGTPKDVYFDQSSHSSKRLYVSTEANVLAALNARTGQIVWRKVFEKNEGVISKLLLASNMLLTVSDNGKLIRSWEMNKGSLLWESSPTKFLKTENLHLAHLSGALKNHQSILLDPENGGFLVTTSNVVRMISQSDGTEIWEHTIKDKAEYAFGVAKSDDRIVVFCGKQKDGMDFVVFKHLDIETGKVLNDDIVTPAPWISHKSVTCELFASKYFICLDTDTRNIAVKNYVNQNREAFSITNLSNLDVPAEEIVDEPSITSFLKVKDNDIFQVKINRKYSILTKVNPQSRLLISVKTLKEPGFFIDYSLPNKNFILAIFKDSSRKLHIDIYTKEDIEKGTPIQSLTSRIPEEFKSDMGAPVQCALYMYKKKEDVSFRVLLVTEDFSMSLIQSVGKDDAKLLWTRNEALSTISKVQMIVLPPSTSASKLELLHAEFSIAQNSGILTMFLNRIKSQIRQIQTYAEQIKKQKQYGDTAFSEEDDDSSQTLKRDQFNIVKIIIAYTEGRKLFALNSQNGNVVWSRFIPQIKKYSSDVNIIEQRSTAHFPLPPQCLLIAPHKQTREGYQTALFTYNPLTGDGLEEPIIAERYKVLQVSVLPMEDEKSVQVVGIVDTEHYFHIYPDTADTRSTLKQKLDSVYIYLTNGTTNSFKGYKVKVESSKFKLYEVWSVNIPSDQSILKLTSKRSDEVVNSVGRVLGDHTVLYKYLNPNLLGVMTMQGKGLKGNLFVYIIDAVTGHIIYQARHKGVDAPVELILSEHWLIYLYYNAKGRRTEISVVELFEGYEEKNHTAFSSLDPVEASMILSQAYLLPISGVSSMVATTTARGITNKNILFGLDNGYVYSLPKNFLDPRRQFKQTPMLQEEGVPPYMPELPLVPQGYINYNQTVGNIRGIHTSAAGLESTSLVLVYGLDIFYTRVTPSKMFDVLKEDFDYIFISGVLSALILVSILCSKLASMRSLKLAWQ